MNTEQWSAFTADILRQLDALTPGGALDAWHHIGPYRVKDTAEAFGALRNALAQTPAQIQTGHLEGRPPCGGYLPLANVHNPEQRTQGRGSDAAVRWHVPTIRQMSGGFTDTDPRRR